MGTGAQHRIILGSEGEVRIRGEVDLPRGVGDESAEVRLRLRGEEDGAIDEVLQCCAHAFQRTGRRTDARRHADHWPVSVPRGGL